MKKHFTLFFLFALIFFTPVIAQQDHCNLKMGTNLGGPADWGAEYPFVDIMRYSRTWITFNHVWVNGGANDWDTQVLDQIPLDDNRYPLELPYPVPGTETEQAVRTVWANTAALKEGTYVILYEGTGEIALSGDATDIEATPGRIEFNLTPGIANILIMEILESQLDDHIRNIRVLLPGTEPTYQTDPWSEEWLEKLAPFKALRFMDWGYTNNSPMMHWEDRTQVDHYTYTTGSGVPYEWWAELCNLKKADAWICVPHLASDDYITEMATFFKENMDEDLTIYVEYSNEIWNWLFEQTQYCHDSLNQNLDWPERLGPKIADVMQIWTDVFGDESDRLVRVLATQNGWFDIGDRIFGQIEAEGKAHLIDAISPSSYMYYDVDAIANLGADATGVDVINAAHDHTFGPDSYILESWQQHANLAADNGKQLIFYEGGQHFTPEPWGTIQPYNLALLEAQIIPEMEGLYERLFDTLSNLMDNDMLMMNFSFMSYVDFEDPFYAQWGSFGILLHQFNDVPPYVERPKYNALVNHIDACETIVSTYERPNTEAIDFKVYPNPVGNEAIVEYRLSKPQEITVELYDVLGTRLDQFSFEGTIGMNQAVVKMGAYPSGIYWLKMENSGEIFARKVVKN